MDGELLHVGAGERAGAGVLLPGLHLLDGGDSVVDGLLVGDVRPGLVHGCVRLGHVLLLLLSLAVKFGNGGTGERDVVVAVMDEDTVVTAVVVVVLAVVAVVDVDRVGGDVVFPVLGLFLLPHSLPESVLTFSRDLDYL